MIITEDKVNPLRKLKQSFMRESKKEKIYFALRIIPFAR